MNLENIENDKKKERIKDYHVYRTHKHIGRVINNAKRLEEEFGLDGLTNNCLFHDTAKFKEPELIPYCWLTEFHRCKDNNIKFRYPSGMEDQVVNATEHHILNSDHHPEYWCRNPESIKIGRNRDAYIQPSGIVVAKDMPEIKAAEMICDWNAMSQEKNSSLHDWADNTIGTRWEFSKPIKKSIYQYIEFFSA
jgi:hypothetical protein